MINGLIPSSSEELEFLVRPHEVSIGGFLSTPKAVTKVMKKLDLSCIQATTAFTGEPIEHTGLDFRQEAESLKIPESCGERLLDQSGGRSRRRLPVAEVGQGEGLRLGLGDPV
jgi:hypothetical protein